MSIEAFIADAVRRALADAPPPRRLLTAREAADYLGMSVSQIRNLRAAGRLAVVMVDTRDRYDRSDLDRLIDESKR